MTISWNTSFSNFVGFLHPVSEEFWRDKPSIRCFVEARWSVATKETRNNGFPQDNVWIVCPDKLLRSSVPKNPAKFENDCISRSVHRLKITQPILAILVSFSSAEDVLSNDENYITLSARKVLKIRRSAFSGTPGIFKILSFEAFPFFNMFKLRVRNLQLEYIYVNKFLAKLITVFFSSVFVLSKDL